MASYDYIVPLSLKHMLLRILTNLPDGDDELGLFTKISKQRPNTKRRWLYKNHLYVMHTMGDVSDNQGIFEITFQGKSRLAKLDVEAGDKSNVATANTISKMEGTYSGKELARNSTRPGSQAAYSVPSLINGQLQTPKHV